MMDSLTGRIAAYRNTAAHNEALYEEFTRLTDSVEFLKRHRDFVEANDWGFGDRAFHYMWLMLLSDANRRSRPVRALEIGVYKGQVISLWALIAKQMRIDLEITGISPFEGNAKPMSRLRRKVRRMMDPRYRRDAEAGNLYLEDDYLGKVSKIFATFDLGLGHCRLIKGRSNDPAIAASLNSERFSIIYIDGDHTFEGVRSDIRSYAPLLEEGGYLVMDDASCFLPGSTFWKGRESVSRACEELPQLGFENVLNVGHDRIYTQVTSVDTGSRHATG